MTADLIEIHDPTSWGPNERIASMLMQIFSYLSEEQLPVEKFPHFKELYAVCEATHYKRFDTKAKEH